MDMRQLQTSAQQRLPAGQPGRHSRFTQALICGVEINEQRLQRVANRKQEAEVTGRRVFTQMKGFFSVFFFLLTCGAAGDAAERCGEMVEDWSIRI